MNNEFYKIHSNLLFSSKINNSLPTNDRQIFLYISNIPQKAFNYAKIEMLNVSHDHFCIAESLIKQQNKNTLLYSLLLDDYLPKKSYYLYKTGKTNAAEKLLQKSLKVSKSLERKGFEFFIFGRVQQYHNLTRIYFGKGLVDKAIATATELIIFLLSGCSSELPDMNINTQTKIEGQYEKEYISLRYLFICQIMFETMEVLRKIYKKDTSAIFIEKTKLFLTPIMPEAGYYYCSTPEECDLKDWILLFEYFCNLNTSLFQIKANDFINKHNTIPARAVKILEAFICQE